MLQIDGGYLGIGFYRYNCEVPFLEMDCREIIGTIWTPFWCVKRMLFWKIYRKFLDGYDVWCLRKNTSSDSDMNKAMEYFKEIRSILNCGWSYWDISLSNPLTFSGLSLVRAGCIEISGINRREANYAYRTALVEKISILTNDYMTSCTK
ncbi:MAG: hypothetical protein LBK06_10455 [Planctomycetaceae bacterium]|nr:hypothetical protein [Planctomycetaceae bacterium]